MMTPEYLKQMEQTHGCELMDAPNRYRKLFRQFTHPGDDADVDGSPAVLLAICNHPDLSAAIAASVDMQKAEWPEKADRALGLTPLIDMVSVCIAWKGGAA